MSRMRIDDHDIPQADVFKNLLDYFPDMIHSIDVEGNIVYANLTAERLLGHTRDELLKMSIWEIYADEIMDKVREGFGNLKRKGDVTVQSVLKDKQGNRIPVEIRSFSIYADDGTFLHTFSILRDLRPIKELQNSLVHAGRLAAIGELSAGVAHDINNPLTVIIMSSDLITSSLRDGDAAGVASARARAEDIVKASRAIQKLSDHLRDFSRGIVEKYEVIDLFDVVDDALFITTTKINSASVTVANTTQKGRCHTTGSANQLQQVFVNLIANACDAMAGRERRQLTIAMGDAKRERGRFWACEIGDTGPGIPPEIVDKIFQSFFTTKPKGKGTGLGLSISRGIVKEHGGELLVNTTPGVGTLFTVLLPQTDLTD